MQNLMANADVQVVAVCDVLRDKRNAAKRAVDAKYGNTDCATYRDLRELLARDDIEPVRVSTRVPRVHHEARDTIEPGPREKVLVDIRNIKILLIN